MALCAPKPRHFPGQIQRKIQVVLRQGRRISERQQYRQATEENGKHHQRERFDLFQKQHVRELTDGVPERCHQKKYASTGTTRLLFIRMFAEFSTLRIIRCKKLIYVWDDEKYKFIKLSGLDKGITNGEFHNQAGFSREEQSLRRVTYGTNEINVPVQSILTLLVLEALTPFYVFQLFSLIVWFAEAYYYYTIAIIIMSVFGISTSIIQTRKVNHRELLSTKLLLVFFRIKKI